jgi:hypothetical protein
MIRQAISPQLEAALGMRALALGNRPTFTSVQPSLRADRIPSLDPVVLVAYRSPRLASPA